MKKEKKRKLYQLFGALGITQRKFEEWFKKYVKRYEKANLEERDEKYLTEISEDEIVKIEERIDKYLSSKRSHNIKKMYTDIENIYAEAGFEPEEAKVMAFTELIFRIVKPIELIYFMDSSMKKKQKRKNKA